MKNLPKSGILVLNKPKGMTSRSVVSRVKRLLQVKKAGHTGTLDPLATGVLPIAFGEATKVIPFLDEAHKVYQVQGRLGIATDSYDADGKEVARGERDVVSEKELIQALQGFLGEQHQVPPIYSAIKVKGTPLYRHVRNGNAVSLQPRKIKIEKIIFRSLNPPFFWLTVHCSRGTYIRSLIHDLGLFLGCFAHVNQLHRQQSGLFSERDAIDLEGLSERPEEVEKKFLSIEDCLNGLPELHLQSDKEREQVLHGVNLSRLSSAIFERKLQGKIAVLKFKGRILAVIEGKMEGSFQYRRVLN